MVIRKYLLKKRDIFLNPTRFSSIIENNNDVFFLIDLKGYWVYLNPAWTSITNYSITETLGTKFTDYIHPEDLTGKVTHTYRQLLNQELNNVNYILRCVTKSGNIRWLEATAQIIKDKRGKITEIAGTLKDITIQKIVEEEVKQKKDFLEQMNLNLEKIIKEEVTKNREMDLLLHQQSRQAAMGEMIGNIAHQWRQPLNAIGLIIQDLQDAYRYNELTEEYLKVHIQKANEIIAHMSQTIDDFRNFFKPDKEKYWFNLKDVIKKTVSFIEASFRNNRIEILLELDEDISAYGFPNEYSQVLLNILNNAKDAHVERKAVERWVKIRLFKDNDRPIVTIADNAGGIPENAMAKIFEPYFTTKEPGKGTGIGLYMSKMIIEKNMAGSLQAHNNGDGAEFMITLPAVDNEVK